MNEFYEFVVKVGLPSAALGYLIIWITKKLNGKLDRLTQAIVALNTLMQKHHEMAMETMKMNAASAERYYHRDDGR